VSYKLGDVPRELTPREIKGGRLAADLTRPQLAGRLSVSVHLISDWEIGQSQPSIANRRELFQQLEL